MFLLPVATPTVTMLRVETERLARDRPGPSRHVTELCTRHGQATRVKLHAKLRPPCFLGFLPGGSPQNSPELVSDKSKKSGSAAMFHRSTESSRAPTSWRAHPAHPPGLPAQMRRSRTPPASKIRKACFRFSSNSRIAATLPHLGATDHGGCFDRPPADSSSLAQTTP